LRIRRFGKDIRVLSLLGRDGTNSKRVRSESFSSPVQSLTGVDRPQPGDHDLMTTNPDYLGIINFQTPLLFIKVSGIIIPFLWAIPRFTAVQIVPILPDSLEDRGLCMTGCPQTVPIPGPSLLRSVDFEWRVSVAQVNHSP
jgi:hypothetical protein